MEVINKYKELEKLCRAKGYSVTIEIGQEGEPLIYFTRIEVGYKGIYVNHKISGEDTVAVTVDAIEQAKKDILKWEPDEKNNIST